MGHARNRADTRVCPYTLPCRGNPLWLPETCVYPPNRCKSCQAGIIPIAGTQFTKTSEIETPSLRFPLQVGGTEPTRPTRFPSRSGGNLKEGGNCELCPCDWYQRGRFFLAQLAWRARRPRSQRCACWERERLVGNAASRHARKKTYPFKDTGGEGASLGSRRASKQMVSGTLQAGESVAKAGTFGGAGR